MEQRRGLEGNVGMERNGPKKAQEARQENTLLEANDYFSEVGAAFEIAQSVARLIESEHAIDYRVNPMQCNRTVHGFEHVARSDEDALNLKLLTHDRQRIHHTIRSRQ